MEEGIQALSAVVQRALMASQLGQTYDGKRDLYKALGYDTVLSYAKYLTMYSRNGVSAAVIDRKVDAAWDDGIIITQPDKVNSTIQQQWEKIQTEQQLQAVFKRVDKLTGLGRYGVLFFGFDDAKIAQELINPVLTNRKNKLLYIKPFGEGSATISTFDTDPTSMRYGLPLTYDIQVADAGDTASINTIKVHYTRVLHITENNLESNIYGTPRLQQIYNQLQDVEKIVGSDAEMFWRGARPGYQGVVDKDFNMATKAKENLKTQIQEFEHDLRRVLINQGVEMKPMAQQIADPLNHLLAQIQVISAKTKIPVRVLLGSEKGELASTQDKVAWNSVIDQRRNEFCEMNIVRPTIDKLIECKVLQTNSEIYLVGWSDLFAPSEKEKADISKVKTEVVAKYVETAGLDLLLPPPLFFGKVLGWEEADIKALEEDYKKELELETPVTAEEEDILNES